MTVAYYVGEPGTGKTTLMCQHAAAHTAAAVVPGVLLDSENVVGLDKWDAPLVTSWEDVPRLVWQEGRHIRFHTFDVTDVDALYREAREGGDVVVACDEASYWTRGSACREEVQKALRVWRHSHAVYLFTSQYPADIHPLVWNLKREVYVFRLRGHAALARLREELGLSLADIERIRQLPDLHYLPYTTTYAEAPRQPAVPLDHETAKGEAGREDVSQPQGEPGALNPAEAGPAA